jgi:hypothetical protein
MNLFASASSYISENLMTVMSPWMRRQLFAMFSAVSILSPVSIHTLISLTISHYISYSLSINQQLFQALYLAIYPQRQLLPRDINLVPTCHSAYLQNNIITQLLNSSSLFKLFDNSLYSASNRVYSSFDMIFIAINRVLNPILEKSLNCPSIYFKNGYSTVVFNLYLMMLSAPFI